MEADIRRAIERAERDATIRIEPEIDRSGIRREADRAGRDFSQRFGSASRSGATSAGSIVGKAFVGGFSAILAAGGIQSVAQTVIGQFQDMMTTGVDFSKTMNNFQGVTRASTQDMAAMQAQARSLGSDTQLAGASASDAALAMTELAKAGFSIDEAMTAARGTLQLATAGQIDAAQAAELQSNAINMFNLKATDAAHVADVLANAAIASSAGIPDIGQALAQVGGVAQGFGETLDGTVAALGMLANAGVKGSDAGTLLKTTLQSITDQGNPAQEAIHQLGLELYKVNGQGQNQFVGFRELFKQLDEAKKRINDPEIFQAQTNVLFGSDAMRGTMLGTVEDFDKMATALERTGAAGEMADAQMKGLPGAIESFKNATEGIQLSAFESLGPAVSSGLSGFVDWMSTHQSDMVGFFTTIGNAAMDMGTVVLSVFGSLAGTGSDLARAFGADGVADSLNFAAEAAQQGLDAIDRGKTVMQQYGSRAQEAAKFTDALGDSVSSLKVVGDDITLDVKDNTPEVEAKVQALGGHLEVMANDPTKLKFVADTDPAMSAADAFRLQQQGKPIDVPFAVHYDAGQSVLPAWLNNITNGGSLNVPVTVTGPAGVPNLLNPAGLPVPPSLQSGPPPAAPPRLFTPGMTPHRATGGAIFGAGTGTSDSIPALLSNGEHVWTADEVNKAGGQGAMYAMRSMVRRFAGGGASDGLTPNAEQLKAIIQQAFPQIQNIGGWRPPDGYNEHSSGQALDLMIPNPNSPEGKALGDQINQWLLQNANSLGIQYDLWQQQDWKPDGSVSGMENRGGATANHMDHVHVRVKPGPATGASIGALNAQSGANGSYEVDQQAVFDAETRVMRDRNDLEVQRKQLAELEAKGTATESQLLAARNDVAEQERDVQSSESKLAEAKQGKFKKAKANAASGGGMDGSGLGESIFGGILQGMGLDGSVFSNPFEWPNVKSGMALANWGGGLLKGALGGQDDGSGAPAGGGIGGFNLPGISDLLKPIGPQVLTPNDVSTGQGAGPAPGPTYQINGNVGMDPKAVTQKFDAAHNQSYRKTVGSVRPG